MQVNGTAKYNNQYNGSVGFRMTQSEGKNRVEYVV